VRTIDCASAVGELGGVITTTTRNAYRDGTDATVPMPCGLEALMTFDQAAEALGISLRQFRRLVDGGKVAFVKVSERSPRIRPSELQRFLDASAVKYSEEAS
jgi:excisionase family DNA binding protein